MTARASSAHPVASLVRQLATAAGLALILLLMLGAAAWGVLALHYWDHANPTLRRMLVAVWMIAALALLAGFLLRRWRWRSLAAFAALFVMLVACWSTIEPSNDRLWEPENAVLTWATIDGDRITLHNVRNFDYRSDTDFVPAYYDRTFDLRQLNSADLFAVYWMGPAIAHIFVSFGFADGAHVAFSIETRREKGEPYSSVAGFFRQYELYYAVGDERDIVRVRTNYRHDDVYMYHIRTSPENARRLFLIYLERINQLYDRPEFYHLLSNSCTINIVRYARLAGKPGGFDIRHLLNGLIDSYLYSIGAIDTTLPFRELRRLSRINDTALAAGDAPDFSERIRAAVPSRAQ